MDLRFYKQELDRYKSYLDKVGIILSCDFLAQHYQLVSNSVVEIILLMAVKVEETV